MNSSDEFLTSLLAAIEQAGLVVVDLAGLEFMDSSGIHALVVAHQRAAASGRAIQVTGATGVVAQVLDLTGVAGLLAGPQAASTACDERS